MYIFVDSITTPLLFFFFLRDEKRAPLKTPAWEAKCTLDA